jgi:hypothetical protein
MDREQESESSTQLVAMKAKKYQHVIPECYQKSWLAPDCPASFEPYVWLISRDGRERKRKAPKNVFVEHDKYTIHLTDGTRNLEVENTLAQIENHFVNMLPKIKNRQRLSMKEFGRLCVFTAAMHARTNAMGRHFSTFFANIHKLVVKGERAHNAPPVTSLQTKDLAQHAHQHMIQATLRTLPQMLFRMSLAILETNDPLGFITSDTPCVWHDPDSHKLPPGMRSPNMGNRKIEITVPITPWHTLLFSHSRLRGYMRSSPQNVDELNWRVRRKCAEYFISRTGETKPSWFEAGVIPPDAWENTEEGKRALDRARRYRDASAKWQREHRESIAETGEKAAAPPSESESTA